MGLNVIATDKDNMIAVLQKNVAEYLAVAGSNSSNSIDVIPYDWDISSKSSAVLPQADIIVCSDCLYNSSSIEPLLEVLEKVSKNLELLCYF